MKTFLTYVKAIEEAQDVSTIRFGEPTAKQHRNMQEDHSLIPIDSDERLLEDPPTNDSGETRVELMELQDRLDLERNAKEMLDKWDVDLLIPFVDYLKENNLSYKKTILNDIIHDSTVVILKQKYLYNRPRPYQINEMIGVKMNHIISKTANSPAYPSGHSTQSRLIAMYLGSVHTDHAESLLELAEECGQSRLNAGVHYPSDHEAGVELAQILFDSLQLHERKSIKYKKLPAHPGGAEGY